MKQAKHEIIPGKRIKNNALCLAVNHDRRKTFAFWENPAPDRPDEYVIWSFDPETGDCFWGNYFSTFEGAIKQWLKGDEAV
jgi:hypothetical protein